MIKELDKDKTCVRLPKSRRKYTQFMSLLSRKPQVYYSFRFEGNFVFLDADELAAVKPLATIARVDQSSLCQCWSGS